MIAEIESSPQRLLLRSGSTSILLDKAAGTAVLQRKLFSGRASRYSARSRRSRTRVNTDVDPASKAEICSTMLILREGGGWTLSARDKQDATAAAAAVREFLGLPAA